MKQTKFKKFLKDNWSWLVEETEESTGESYSGREPLLTKEAIIELAREIFNSNKIKI